MKLNDDLILEGDTNHKHHIVLLSEGEFYGEDNRRGELLRGSHQGMLNLMPF